MAATRSATARRRSGLETEVEIRGHRLVVDEPADAGGTDKGPRPTELLAASVASCITITLVMYAERKGWEIGEVEASTEYETPSPGTPAALRTSIRVPGDLTDEQRERLLAIAGKCPVSRTLADDDAVVEYDLVTMEG